MKFDVFVYWLVLLPAAPSLLDGITGFCVIDAAMLMLPLSEDWPVLLGVWPAPSFQPYVFAALHAALLSFVIQVVLLVSGRNILVSPWLLDLRLSLFSASPTALLRLSFWEGMIQSKEVVKESLFAGPSCLFPCSQAILSAVFLAGFLSNGMLDVSGIHGGVYVLAPAIELLLQQAAAASCGGALQGIFKLEALFFWLVLDVTRTFVLECLATATELLLQQAAAASALSDVFALVAHYFCLVGEEFVTVSYREVGHTTASGLTVGNGDQASGRVDVPGGGLQLSSAASQVFGKVPGPPDKLWDWENATFQVLVKQFSGQHLAVSVHGDWLVADVVHCLQLRSLVPAEAFYLVKAGRHLDSCKTLREEKLLAGDTVTVCVRLKGGSSNLASHADWYCAACSGGGCWASRLQCYRCGFPRIESEKILAGMPLGRGKGGGKATGRGVVVPPRETQFPGRSAGPQMSSCPIWRHPRQPKAKRTDTPSPPPPPQGCRVVEILRDLGCSLELLTRLQERLDVSPPSAPPLVPGSQAKRLADLQASLARAQSHQLVLKDQRDAMEVKLTKARQALSDNSDRIATLTAEVVAAKAEISPPASVNHMDSGDEDNQSFQSSEDQMLEENEYPEEYEPVREGLKRRKMVAKPKAKSSEPDHANQARLFLRSLSEEKRLKFLGECAGNPSSACASQEVDLTPRG